MATADSQLEAERTVNLAGQRTLAGSGQHHLMIKDLTL